MIYIYIIYIYIRISNIYIFEPTKQKKEMDGEFHEQVKPFWDNFSLRSPSRFSYAAWLTNTKSEKIISIKS